MRSCRSASGRRAAGPRTDARWSHRRSAFADRPIRAARTSRRRARRRPPVRKSAAHGSSPTAISCFRRDSPGSRWAGRVDIRSGSGWSARSNRCQRSRRTAARCAWLRRRGYVRSRGRSDARADAHSRAPVRFRTSTRRPYGRGSTLDPGVPHCCARHNARRWAACRTAMRYRAEYRCQHRASRRSAPDWRWSVRFRLVSGPRKEAATAPRQHWRTGAIGKNEATYAQENWPLGHLIAFKPCWPLNCRRLVLQTASA